MKAKIPKIKPKKLNIDKKEKDTMPKDITKKDIKAKDVKQSKVKERVKKIKDVKKSKVKLGVELLCLSVIPIILIGIITCVLTWKTFTSNATSQIEQDLYTAAIAVKSSFEQDVGEYRYAINGDGSTGDLWKGGYNISKSHKLLDTIKENATIDITVLNEESIVVTTAINEKTGEQKNIGLSKKIIKRVIEGGYKTFDKTMEIDGVEQFMYAIPLVQIDNSEAVGMIVVSTDKSSSMESTYEVLRIVIIVIGLIIIAMSVFVIVFTRGITGSLKAGFKALDLLSHGDLRVEQNTLKLNRKDEIGQMSRSIYTLSQEFRKIISNNIEMIKDIEDTANELDMTATNTKDSVKIVDNAMENMATTATQQAAIVSEVNNDMNVLGDMIKNTYTEIKSINEYNTDMQNSGRIANKIVSELTYIRESLNNIIEVINKQTTDTYDLTKAITKYAEMISEFADETNLLALNATIEAARVGEEGKGFAIVASQIQGLADQSAVVSSDISKTVALLVGDSKKSMATMTEVNSVIERLNSNIDDTKEIFNIVNEGIGYSANGLKKIQEQTAVIDNSRGSIMKVVQELEAVSKRNIKCATDTEEVTKHIGQLFDEVGNIKKVTEKLVESVCVFEI